MSQEKVTITDRLRQQLTEAWEKHKDQPLEYYTRALGTHLVEFVDLVDKSFRTVFTRLKVLESQQAAILSALNITPEAIAAATGAPAEGAAPANGQAPPAPSKPVNTRDMVRVDSMGNEMTPQEQDAEERADMMTDGKIDTTRYVPRGSVPGPQPLIHADGPQASPNGQS